MLTLTDGILLYHGSYAEVSKIDLRRCKPGKDFGRGFYVTTSYEQAKNFVPLSINNQVNKRKLPSNYSIGYISIFRFHTATDVTIRIFESADKDWLHFVASNRKGSLFPTVRRMFKNFDIIGGKIANDQTARTLQIYTSGGYGEPGSQTADNIAITTLLPNRLEDQFCFRSRRALQTLEFVRRDLYDINSKRFG